MDIDILAALADEAPARGSGTCKIQRWLDTLPAEARGRDELVEIINTTDPRADHYRTLKQVARVLGRLGLATGAGAVGDHRAQRCKCAD